MVKRVEIERRVKERKRSGGGGDGGGDDGERWLGL